MFDSVEPNPHSYFVNDYEMDPHNYRQDIDTSTYQDEDDNNTTTTTTTAASETHNYDNNNTEYEVLFDDNETNDLSIANNESENSEEQETNYELEEGEEISTVEPPLYIQDLQNLSTQVRNLLNDDDIIVIDGRERLLSLLSQIDNLHTT